MRFQKPLAATAAATRHVLEDVGFICAGDEVQLVGNEGDENEAWYFVWKPDIKYFFGR